MLENFYILIILFLIKHFLADWVLQSDEIAKYKGNDLKFLAIHCLHHSILTMVILFFVIEVQLVLILGIFEFFIHGIIDWIKANPFIAKKFLFPNHIFWVLIGLDQLIHQLFYVGIVYYLLTIA